MKPLRSTILVTIEIDPLQAMPCNCGNRSNTFPDWTWKYQNREQTFINEIWSEFRSCFDYDGLACNISAVEQNQFTGILEPDDNDRLYNAIKLIEEVEENIYPEIDDPPSEFDKERTQECEEVFSKLNDALRAVREYVGKAEFDDR